MSMLEKHFSLVKEQMQFHEKMAEKYKSNPFRATLHKTTYDRLSALYTDLEVANLALEAPRPEPTPSESRERTPIQLSLTAEELNGLPQELIEELTGADKTEFTIINAIEEAGGVITLDRLLIALYKKTGEIHKREQITSRLYRIGQKNLVFNVPGKKGVYSTEQLSLEDAAKLFGTLKQKT